MATVERPWPLLENTPIPNGKLSWNAIDPGRKPWLLSSNLLDETSYKTAVLQLQSPACEDDLDNRVALEARNLGLLPFPVISDIEGLTSSISTATIASNYVNQSSTQAHSTATTSCASSEHRPAVQHPHLSERSLTGSDSSSFPLEAERKKKSPLRRGIRKMTGFRRKRSAAVGSPTLTSISSDADSNNTEDTSPEVKSPSSIKSSKSSWSQPLSTTKFSYEQATSVEADASKRSAECKEMLDLRMAQLDERARFLQFQAAVIAQLGAQRQKLKAEKRQGHERRLVEQCAKVSGACWMVEFPADWLQNDKAVEDLEARQLEEEMKMEKEHEVEKRTVMVRLRHMEAYCQNPTPPPTPVDPASGRPSTDSALPERKVTDKDYHNLAQQYRERDAMDTLHTAKINVLRGKQKKAVERLILKKEQEIEDLEKGQQGQLAEIDQDFASLEESLKLALGAKRARLEARWRTQALIARTKIEKATGLEYAPLPDVVALDDTHTPGIAL
ncbi:hypothetical protein A1O3_01111 [Capronia epimyces CBS 606.96]|uniref:Uncharacterized protein n=1 Tax=Capronia epimyces CBS 606.96 TaxID=1182542 RepID=W9ZDG5_9EURO|nr:uncharacterized protein A1O3_01111 [Capronia epimyces CBS 606.96]EXJ92559.1 hypothetical protein A1O3_01111 [Capronia epimyces CBS 606.96]